MSRLQMIYPATNGDLGKQVTPVSPTVVISSRILYHKCDHLINPIFPQENMYIYTYSKYDATPCGPQDP